MGKKGKRKSKKSKQQADGEMSGGQKPQQTSTPARQSRTTESSATASPISPTGDGGVDASAAGRQHVDGSRAAPNGGSAGTAAAAAQAAAIEGTGTHENGTTDADSARASSSASLRPPPLQLNITEVDEHTSDTHSSSQTTRRSSRIVRTPLSPGSRDKLISLQGIVRSLREELDRAHAENRDLRMQVQRLQKEKKTWEEAKVAAAATTNAKDDAFMSTCCPILSCLGALLVALLLSFVVLGYLDDEHICPDSKDYVTRVAGVFVREFLPLPSRTSAAEFVIQ